MSKGSGFAWEKCHIAVLGAGGFKIRKGEMHLGDCLLRARMKFLARKKATFQIAPHSHAYPYKPLFGRATVLWLVDARVSVALGLPDSEGAVDEETKLMLRLVGDDKWFKAMAGSNLTMMDEIIRLCAGGGIFLLVYHALMVMFG